MKKLTFLAVVLFAGFGLFSQYSNIWLEAPERAEREDISAQQQQEKKEKRAIASREVILMQNGAVSVTEGTFYDTGGEAGEYGSNENLILTLNPATPGQRVKVTFLSFDTEFRYDRLHVFNGPDTARRTELAILTGALVDMPTFIGDNLAGALTFMFVSDVSGTKAGWKANVECITAPPQELKMLGVSVPAGTAVNQATPISFSIRNRGSESMAGGSYTLQLKDASNNVIFSAPGVDLPVLKDTVLSYTWLPASEGSFQVKGHIECATDADQSNNTTELRSVTVFPLGHYIAKVGTSKTLPSVRLPIDFYWKAGYRQTIYTPEQLGTNAGTLTGLYYEYSFVDTTIIDKPIKVWVGETEKSYQDTAAGSFISPRQLTLVCDTLLTFNKGEGILEITFSTPYQYNGGNLVVHIFRPQDSKYFKAANKFYCTMFKDAKRTRMYHTDNPLEPYDSTKLGSITEWVPNTTFVFATEGMGVISGSVTSAGAPLEGVRVETVGQYPVATVTDAAGNYSLAHLKAGMYNLKFSKYTYIDHTEDNVTVTADANTTVDVVMSEIMKVMVSGTVTASDSNQPLSGVVVKLEGYKEYVDTTDADGKYLLTGVYADNKTYSMTAKRKGFQEYTDSVVANGVHIVKDFVMNEVAYPVKKVIAEQADPNVNVSWVGPLGGPATEPQWISWATAEIGEAIGGPASFAVAQRYTAEQLATLEVVGMPITKIKFVPAEASASYKLKVWTGGNASAPGEVVYEQVVGDIVVETWNEVALTQPVEVPDGAELWFGYEVTNAAAKFPAGMDAGPTVDGFGNMVYLQGAWKSLLAVNPQLIGNFSIAAFVGDAKGFETEISRLKAEIAFEAPKTTIEHGKAYPYAGELKSRLISKISDDNKESRAFVNYTLYRLVKDQPQAQWTQLVAATTDTTHVDNTWATLPAALYQYAVVANYSNNVVSAPKLSNIIAKSMTVAYTVNIATNSGDPANGAVVTLTNQDGNADHVYQATAEGAAVTFPEVWRGTYNLSVVKGGFNAYEANDIVIDDQGLSHSANLVEIILEPYGLDVEQDGSTANFSWNNTVGISDDIESYDSFIIENIGNYIMVDVDGKPSYGIQNVQFPNAGYTGSFIVFVPSQTNPPLPAAWAGHSGDKYLTCFAAMQNTANNDWLITPEIKVRQGFEFSFWARSITANYGLERFNVGISTGGTTPSDFTIISGSSYIEAPVEWTKYTYSGSALEPYMGQNVRFAIQCVSNDAFAFMVDDIFMGIAKSESKSFSGYSVYLNGTEKATGITETSYQFTNVPVGTHTAGVKAVYTSGSSSIQTTEFTMAEPVFNVTFKVKKESNNAPIQGAKVLINNDSVLTNNQGVATISLNAGTYNFTVKKPGYQDYTGTATIDSHKEIEVAMAVGLGDEVARHNVVLYPNPATDMLTLTLENTSSAMVEIYSNSGALVNSFEMNNAVKEISVANLNSGVYVVRVISNNVTTVQRFIKK